MGLYLEAAATHSAASPGEKITIRIEAVNRSDAKARLESIRFSTAEHWSGTALTLANNEANFLEPTIKMPADLAYNSTYWLREPCEPRADQHTYALQHLMSYTFQHCHSTQKI